MIKAVFAVKGEKFIGFTVKGHSGYAESGNDIICAGVSSALMLTVNTITDFFSVAADMDIRPDNEGSLCGRCLHNDKILLHASYNS